MARLLAAVKNSKSISCCLDIKEINPELGTAVFVVKGYGQETCKARFSYFKLNETTTQCVVQFFDWLLPTYNNFLNRRPLEKHINKIFGNI